MQRLCKNQLLNYAQKRNLNLPVYSFEREGPLHASRFRCMVSIDGQTFESPEFFPTLKDAEHAAAKVALTSLSPVEAEEDDSALYKNLLHELVQREGFRLPVYSTNKSGEAHIPIFVSNVEIEGELFTGKEAKTKKQAEMSAAKVAYTILKERKECSEVKSHHTAIPSSKPATVTGGRDSSSYDSCVKDASLSNVQSSPSLPNSANMVIDSSAAASTSTRRRVIVYSRKTNVEIAEDGILLPISDENYVAYSYPK